VVISHHPFFISTNIRKEKKIIMKTGKILIARNLSGDLVIAAEADKVSELVSLIDTPEFVELYGDSPEFAIYPRLDGASYDDKAHRRAKRQAAIVANAKVTKKVAKKAAKKAVKKSTAPAAPAPKTLEEALG